MTTKSNPKPFPKEFLDWQVALRHHTMVERNGTPHMGVVPLVTVKRPGVSLGVISHSIVCGLLPNAEQLDAKTREFQTLYDEFSSQGAKTLYDRGLSYLVDYYESAADFDPDSVTTLLPDDSALKQALAAEPTCALVFNVFDPNESNKLGAPRCQQIEAVAELHRDGPVYDNVWWHNTLFHGKADGHVVVRFRHERSWNTCFGGFEALDG